MVPGLDTFKLPTLNVGMLGGGTVFNAIPREAWFTVDLRSLDTTTQDKLATAVVAVAKQAAEKEGVGFRMEEKSLGDYSKARPQSERLNQPVVQTALAVANFFRKSGSPEILPADLGSTDANNAVAMGILAVAWSHHRPSAAPAGRVCRREHHGARHQIAGCTCRLSHDTLTGELASTEGQTRRSPIL